MTAFVSGDPREPRATLPRPYLRPYRHPCSTPYRTPYPRPLRRRADRRVEPPPLQISGSPWKRWLGGSASARSRQGSGRFGLGRGASRRWALLWRRWSTLWRRRRGLWCVGDERRVRSRRDVARRRQLRRRRAAEWRGTDDLPLRRHHVGVHPRDLPLPVAPLDAVAACALGPQDCDEVAVRRRVEYDRAAGAGLRPLGEPPHDELDRLAGRAARRSGA